MLGRGNRLILGLAVLAAVGGGFVEHRRQLAVPTPSSLVGQSLPALTLADLDGHDHPLSDYRGHRLLLNLWASWCAPCLGELPALQHAQDKFGERGVIVIGIAMDDPARVRAFLAQHPVRYPILLGRLGADDTSITLGNRGQTLPYSMLVGADGSILATHEGALSDAMLNRWLATAAVPH